MLRGGRYTPLDHAHWAVFWARVLRWNFGIRMHIHGKLLDGSQVLVSNHLGYLDIITFLAAGPVNFVSKADVEKWPLVGGLARSAGTLFLKREKKADIPRVIEAFAGVAASGSRVIFFPEGTSSPGNEVLKFHASLFDLPAREKWNIQPAAIYYTIPGGTAGDTASRICYWGDMEFVPHFREMIRIPSMDCHIVLGDRTFCGSNRKELAAELHHEVDRLFGKLRSDALQQSQLSSGGGNECPGNSPSPTGPKE